MITAHKIKLLKQRESCLRSFWQIPWIQVGVSKNRGTPKSSILIGFSHINHPFWGIPIFGNTQIKLCLPCFHLQIFTVQPPASTTSRPEPIDDKPVRRPSYHRLTIESCCCFLSWAPSDLDESSNKTHLPCVICSMGNADWFINPSIHQSINQSIELNSLQLISIQLSSIPKKLLQ